MILGFFCDFFACIQRTCLLKRKFSQLILGFIFLLLPDLTFGLEAVKTANDAQQKNFPQPIAPPVWINHNSITPLPGAASDDQLRFLPVFVFTHGTCLPAASFNSEGELGGGLKAAGKMDGKCLGYDAANIYTHSVEIGEQVVHIYALYYPKDGSTPNSVGGHRHDWEHVLVWTTAGIATDLTFSQHSGWYTLSRDHIRWEDSHPVVYVGKAKHGMYHSPNNGPGGITEGLCYFCDTRSEPGLRWLAPHRLLAFDSLTSRQQELLQSEIWGSANSPFRPDLFPTRPNAIAAGEHCHDRGCECDRATGSCPGFP